MPYIKQDIGIGQNIRALRKQAKLTQTEITAKLQVLGCSISCSSYGKIENDRHTIKVSELVALQHILKCEWGDFFKGLKL